MSKISQVEPALYPNFSEDITHVFIGETEDTLACRISVIYSPLLIQKEKIEECLDIWSRDIAGNIALELNRSSHE